jgi:uncharacterized membrane protein
MKSPLRDARLTERQENPARIEAFSDGVFGVAITLLVIDIRVPSFGHEPTNSEMWLALGAIGSKLLIFAISFIMIGFFWIGHHLIFWSIERSNRILMWVNLVFLFPIVCLPAATALVGEYPKNGTAATVYVAVVVSTALLLDLVWWYASSSGLISSAMKPESVMAQHRRLLLVTLIMVVAGCIAPFFPQFAIGAMLVAILYVIVTTGTRMLVD